MDPFVRQLEDLCAQHPTRAKWVFVTSHAIGRTIGDRLVLSGTDWANLRFVTPLDIALRMGAPFLVERGIDPSEEGLGPALIMRLLLELPATTSYFRPLARQPQMAVALWSTLRELRMAGVRVADIASVAFTSPDKHAELRGLLAAYEAYLVSTNRGDRATVFEEALRHPDWCPIQPADCWTDQPNIIWSPLQRRLIDSTPGHRIVPVAIDLPGVAVPRRLKDSRVDWRAPELIDSPREESESASAAARAPGGGAPGASTRSRQANLFHAGGAEAEIEEVFRRILASGRSLDLAEIVCASPQYAPLVWEKAMRHEWPVTTAQGIPAAMTRPGRALLALVEWIEDDFAAGRLRRMLQSGDIAIGDDVSITAGRAARLLVKAQAAWGRATYRLSLSRLASSSRRAAARDDLSADVRDGLEKRAMQCDELAAWIDSLVSAVPEPASDGTIDLQRIVKCAHTFVAEFTARTSALDHLSASSLEDAINELQALGAFRCPMDQALRFLRERVEGVQVGVDRPRPGHLHLSSFATAGLAGRPLVFVVGLEEGRVFPAPFEDPILLDSEREKISALLTRSTDRTDEAVYTALTRLAAIGSQRAASPAVAPRGGDSAGATRRRTAMSPDPAVVITLSYSCRDLREYRQTYASWLLLQVYRTTSGKPKATYQDLHDHLGVPKSCVPDAPESALDESRWWLNGVTKAGESSRPAVFARYPSLAAGAKAADARDSDAFTEFDGHVPAAGTVLDPCRTEMVISPTQLEAAAQCPFRHFLRRGLGVEAIESGSRDRDVWLDPLLRGSLLHDLYAQLMRRCRDEKRRAKLPDDHDWLQNCGRTMLDELAIEMPPSSSEVRDRETHLFLADLTLFAEAEASLDPSRSPVGFEVGFGRGDGLEEEPLARAEPIVIDAGGGLTFRVAGRIDRIDQVGPSTFEIVDYKTGGYWADSWKGTFAGGTRLQHALYGLAALELLKRKDKKARVAGAEYYFSSAKGQQERKRIPTSSSASLAAVLGDLRSVIASGLFVHAADDESCKWCDYGHACGQNAAKRAEIKLADPVLAPFAKLVAHE